MTFPILLAVLAAAALHAGWNAIIRSGGSKVAAMTAMTVCQGGIGLAIGLWTGFPTGEALRWLALSVLVHGGYQTFLVLAYEQGDLSRVYPIARGSAPLLVTLVTLAFAIEPLARSDLLAVAVLASGIALIAFGALRAREARRLIPYALATACMTAAYTLTDGLGARASGAPVAYVGWILAGTALTFLPVAFLLRGRAIVPDAATWKGGALGAVASFGAYAIAVWAMTQAPIALVAALRETSILFAVLIGWAMGERMDLTKGIAAAIIVAGVLMVRL